MIINRRHIKGPSLSCTTIRCITSIHYSFLPLGSSSHRKEIFWCGQPHQFACVFHFPYFFRNRSPWGTRRGRRWAMCLLHGTSPAPALRRRGRGWTGRRAPRALEGRPWLPRINVSRAMNGASMRMDTGSATANVSAKSATVSGI